MMSMPIPEYTRVLPSQSCTRKKLETLLNTFSTPMPIGECKISTMVLFYSHSVPSKMYMYNLLDFRYIASTIQEHCHIMLMDIVSIQIVT